VPDQDTPDGQYAHLEKSGKKLKSKPWKELWNGVCNYRMWGLAACYAYTFGVEVGSLHACLLLHSPACLCLLPCMLAHSSGGMLHSQPACLKQQ
jgi:hypothetical protein